MISKKKVVGWVIVYPLIWLVAVVWDVVLNMNEEEKGDKSFKTMTFYMLVPVPLYKISHIIKDYCVILADTLVILFTFSTVALPAIIILVCGIIQIIYLLRKGSGAANNDNLRETTQRKMTVTIVILTILCFLCNVPFACMAIRGVLSKGRPPLSINVCYYSYVISTLLPFINSALNPITMLIRGSAPKESIRRVSHQINNRVSMVFFNGLSTVFFNENTNTPCYNETHSNRRSMIEVPGTSFYNEVSV